MDLKSRGKSSPSEDFNSPSKSSRLEEEPEAERLELSFQKKMSLKNSLIVHWEKLSLNNSADKLLLISNDTKSWF